MMLRLLSYIINLVLSMVDASSSILKYQASNVSVYVGVLVGIFTRAKEFFSTWPNTIDLAFGKRYIMDTRLF